jgi:serine/threonine protein kinase
MIETLVYLTKSGISHRDIKLENILINDEFNLKITDFGFASFSKDNLREIKGTAVYMAPEIMLLKDYKGEEVDIFSMGVVTFALLTGLRPFNVAHELDPKYKLLKDH